MGNQTDRFGNPFAPTLSYARGKILSSTEDDFRKLQHAWSIVRQRGPENIFIFTGLDHSLPMTPEDLRWADDEIAPALYFDRMKALALDHLKKALDRESRVALVDLTRLAVTYELLAVDDIRAIVKLAHDKGAIVYVDDAGGARVGPASFDQPKMLELGVDIGATGLDKYGTLGPRFGLMGGDCALVARVRAKAFECGLECRQMLYPAVVRTLERYSPKR